LVRAPELAAFQAQISGRRLTPSKSRSPLPRAAGFPIVPAGTRPFYCFTAVELTRSPLKRARAGMDYCAKIPALLSSRDSAVSVYAPASAGRSQGSGVEAPVYKGNVPPAGLTSRRAAFVGWLREVLTPGVVLQQVL